MQVSGSQIKRNLFNPGRLRQDSAALKRTVRWELRTVLLSYLREHTCISKGTNV